MEEKIYLKHLETSNQIRLRTEMWEDKELAT